MAFPIQLPSLAGLLARRALLVYAATWTAVAVAVAAVAVAAFAPELAFVWAIGPGTPLSRACPPGGDGGFSFSVALPLDGPPWDVVCVPAGLFGRAKPASSSRSSSPSSWSPPLFGSPRPSGCGRMMITTSRRHRRRLPFTKCRL